MKTLKFFTIFCALSALTLGAEVIDLTQKSAWTTPNSKPIFKNGKIFCTTLSYFKSKKSFVIDGTKAYTITMDLKRMKADDKKPTLYLGYEGFDANGNALPVYTYQTRPNTFSEITAPAKKGDTVIRVKNASKWLKGNTSYIMTNAKQDFSDIPNKNVLAIGIKNVKKEAADYVVTLNKPLKADVAAGAKVRVHVAGGYFYVHPLIRIGDDKVVNVKAVTKGFNDYTWMNKKVFPRGVPKWKIIIIANDTRSKAGLEISNAKLTIE